MNLESFIAFSDTRRELLLNKNLWSVVCRVYAKEVYEDTSGDSGSGSAALDRVAKFLFELDLRKRKNHQHMGYLINCVVRSGLGLGPVRESLAQLKTIDTFVIDRDAQICVFDEQLVEAYRAIIVADAKNLIREGKFHEVRQMLQPLWDLKPWIEDEQYLGRLRYVLFSLKGNPKDYGIYQFRNLFAEKKESI